MTERAEGFWWVRCVGDAPARAWAPSGWFVAHVRGFAMAVPGRAQEIECHSARWEWGPYLGKEPPAACAVPHPVDHEWRPVEGGEKCLRCGSLRTPWVDLRGEPVRFESGKAILAGAADD